MIVAGFGFRKGATMTSLQSALAMAVAGKAPVDALATVRPKARQLAPLARELAVPLIPLDPHQLGCQPTLTRSAASLAAYG